MTARESLGPNARTNGATINTSTPGHVVPLPGGLAAIWGDYLESERALLRRALEGASWGLREAARALDAPFSTFQRALGRHPELGDLASRKRAALERRGVPVWGGGGTHRRARDGKAEASGAKRRARASA